MSTMAPEKIFPNTTEPNRCLRHLARLYPSVEAVSGEIIHLRAQLDLPKGTEHFISDVHGGYEAFRSVLSHASGSIRRKIDISKKTSQFQCIIGIFAFFN